MIKSLKLKFGRAPQLEAQTFEAEPITVFVGPNNSGKSKILIEIEQFCQNGHRNENAALIDSIELQPVEDAEIDEKIDSVTLKPSLGEAIHEGHIIVGKRGNRNQVPLADLKIALRDPNARANQLCQWYLRYNTLILNGRNRIDLVKQQAGGNLQDEAHTSFQALFRDDAKREEARRIVYEAFGQYLVLDPTNLGNLNLRLSEREPANPLEERGIHQEAVDFHAQAKPISESSDGVKAFTGMIIEMIAGDPSVLLVDEPEAFLHPSLSFKLGKEVSGIMSGTQKRLFVSTHSSNFVMGCIQSGAPVNIIRLTYRNGVATARLLPNEDILRLMRNPLLRSTNVLSGLFYEAVVVTESDADRAFYQEINDRLLKHSNGRGIPNCLFIHAQNKQTVKTIIKPLRELGIPVAGIVDIDVLKDGGQVWTSFLDSGFIPELEREPLANLRASILRKFQASGKNMKTEGGINILDEDDREASQNLLTKLREYGLFVVPHGELESWLPQIGATGHGPDWLVEMFEKIGEDPEDANFLRPSNDDVWEFIDQVNCWFSKPDKKGIPS
jgi:ABC-type cobalamin/Fe3+-siderophores transport system ATPase subunit